MHLIRLIAALALLVFTIPLSAASGPVTVAKEDKCPVCGMFVAKYPDFVAQIVFTDGSYAVFDGAKDMFKYFLHLKKYNPGKNTSDITSVYVTDYYSLTLIDGRTASYVIGSDVFGPMGRELIPLAQEQDARSFMKDHTGKQVLRFEAVTPELLQGLD